MNQSSNSGPALPGWARAADGLTVVLALMASYVIAFGGIRIGEVFSMSTPWRALIALTLICGVRHYLVPAPAIYHRAGSWLGAVAPRPVYERVRSWLQSVAPRQRHVEPDTASERRLQALHIVGLWCLAVAQPILDVVGRSPEFFIAHGARPADLLALVVVLCLGGPAACLLAVRLAGLAGGTRWRRRIATAVIAGLAAVVALAALKPFSGADGGALVALAALAGTAAAVVYRRFAPVRLFATFLIPAVLVVPAVFFLNPGVTRLLASADETGALEGVGFASTPPVVVVVFDQFQLAALLDREGDIDRAAFPNFAALADDATWFRNGTGVAELTTYALPAILTGNYPVAGRLPVAAEHPANLFTLLGGTYRLHVQEPLTELCPETLCPPERGAFSAWLARVMGDLAVVYLTVVLPDELAAPLPPVTQGWNDFVASQTFQNRWRTARVDDRRQTATRFIQSITGADEPVLHFLHVLLPHEPWLYLPTGQQFTLQRHNLGLSEGRWNADPWAAALNYQRYLLQVKYVDTLLGQLVARLREVGIYDDALIVITADHGASLRPGSWFRRPDEASFAEIAGVPLFIKRSGQRQGEVVDANVEVIDIVPTLAAELGAALPWTPDGANAVDPAHVPRPTKVLFHDDARNRMQTPGNLHADLRRSAARKFELFETGDPLDAPTPDRRYGALIGLAADPLRTAAPAEFEVIVDALPLMRDVDPDADFVPAHVTGAVAGLEDGAPPPALAIAINGVIAAVTRPYSFPVAGRRHAWDAVIDPHRLESGANTLEVFEVQGEGGAESFALAATGGDRTADPRQNLIRDEEVQRLGVRVSGFYETEWAGVRPFRWTRGDARLVVPIDPEAPPSSLAVEVLISGGPKQLNIAVDGCTLFDEVVNGRWSAAFDLRECRLAPPDLEIALRSDTHVPESSDNRTLGVAVGRVELRGTDPAP